MGLEYSGISLKGAQVGRLVCHQKSTTLSRLGEMPEGEVARRFVDGKRRAACQPVTGTLFSYDAPEGTSEGSKIASMCKANYFFVPLVCCVFERLQRKRDISEDT